MKYPIVKFKTFQFSNDFEIWQKEKNPFIISTDPVKADENYGYGIFVTYHSQEEMVETESTISEEVFQKQFLN
jgi:hypothetical protein